MGRVAKRMAAVKSSATLDMKRKVADLASTGRRVFDLGIGEADYPAPPPVSRALAAAAVGGRSHYTAVQGIVELREQIAVLQNALIRSQRGGQRPDTFYTPDEIVVGVGSKHLQYSAAMAVCDPGDEVILLAPYWVSYPDMVRMADAHPVVVGSTPENGFVPPIEQVEAALTPRTRMIFLNSPGNPSGMVWTRRQVRELCELVLSRGDLYLLSDEIYAQIVFGDTAHASPAAVSEAVRRRLILTSGMSKAYSMGGWRVGYACVRDRDVRSAMVRVAANTTSSAPSFVQEAAIAFARAPERVEAMRRDYEDRARAICGRLNAMGLPTLSPRGAFYAFADVTSLLGARLAGRTLRCASDVAWALLEDAGVACVGGDAFGDPNHVRFSFVVPLSEIEAACDAMEAFVLRYRKAAPQTVLVRR